MRVGNKLARGKVFDPFCAVVVPHRADEANDFTVTLKEVQLPGGGIDAGEHPVAALHREVFEETGWSIAAPRRLGAFRRFTYMPEYDLWAEKLCTIYLALPVRRHGPPSEPGHTALWLSPEAALGMLYNDGDADFLARAMR